MFATCSAATVDAFSSSSCYGAPYGDPNTCNFPFNVVFVLQTRIPKLIEAIYHNYMGRTSTFSVATLVRPMLVKRLCTKKLKSCVYVIYFWHLLFLFFFLRCLRLWAYKKDKLNVLQPQSEKYIQEWTMVRQSVDRICTKQLQYFWSPTPCSPDIAQHFI